MCVFNFQVLNDVLQVDVNGPSTAPVYQFLKSSAGGFLGDLIKWNFEKFLVDKNGKVVERYQPTTSPFQIEVWFSFSHLVSELRELRDILGSSWQDVQFGLQKLSVVLVFLLTL